MKRINNQKHFFFKICKKEKLFSLPHFLSPTFSFISFDSIICTYVKELMVCCAKGHLKQILIVIFTAPCSPQSTIHYSIREHFFVERFMACFMQKWINAVNVCHLKCSRHSYFYISVSIRLHLMYLMVWQRCRHHLNRNVTKIRI